LDDAFTFAHAHGVLFVGGTVATIGASGGWLLNGGHGVLTGTHGLGVDRVLQFEIVTPDGVVRTANRCINKDLFWALRGGGGGAFGVVLSSTHMASPETPITGSIISFPATVDNQRAYVNMLMENVPRWRLQGWTGPSYLNGTFLSNPMLNVSEAVASLSPAVAYAKSQNGSAVFRTYSSFFEYYVSTINGTLVPPQPIVEGLFMTSRVITEDVFANSASRERLVNAIFETVEVTGMPPSLMVTPPYLYGRTHPAEDRGTSVHPAWYKAPLLVLATSSFRPQSSFDERRAAVAALRHTTERFKELARNGCAYANEADPWLDDWEDQIWGENYARLLRVKKKFDPSGLLSCWHCVGWSKDLPGYECISGLSPHGV
jgi:FAD/FMN-containing dehydrogenase